MKPLIGIDKQPFLPLPPPNTMQPLFTLRNTIAFFILTKGPVCADQYTRRLNETFLPALNVLWIELTLIEHVTVKL